MLKLRIEDDEGGETLVAIVRDEITIGREEGNTIRLPERNVSRQHARLVRRDDGLYVESVAARYGMFKNGERVVGAAPFGADDTFLIGDYKLSLRDDRPRPEGEIEPAVRFQEETTRLTSTPQPAPQPAPEGTEVMAADPARLVVISSNFAGQDFPLTRREMVIGRGDGCDIIIDHRSVSLRHIKIVSEGPRAHQIIDLNSKNGVLINGDPYRSTYVKRGDEIELGHVRFRFVEPGEAYTFDASAVPAGEHHAACAPVGMIALVLVALVAIAGAAVFFLRASPEPDAPVVVAADTRVREAVRSGLDEARVLLTQGKLERSIGLLEGLERGAQNGAERSALGELLAAARAERPFLGHYRRASSALERAAPFEAIEELSAIPDHSVFAALAGEQGLDERAIEQARTAIERDAQAGETERGAARLDEFALFVPENDERVGALRALLGAPAAAAEEAAPEVAEPRAPNKRKARSTKAARAQRAKQKREDESPSKEELSAGVKSARKSYFSGDYAAALSTCGGLVRHGAKECHGIMAQVYKRQKRYDEACSSFKRALRHNPSSNAIRGQMEDIRCGE